jgi:hypothetical protein
MIQIAAAPAPAILTVPNYVLRAVSPALQADQAVDAAEAALSTAVERQSTRLQSLATALGRWRHAQPDTTQRDLNGAIYARLRLAVDSPEYQRVAKVLSRAWSRTNGKEPEKHKTNGHAPSPAPVRIPDEQVRALVSDRAMPKDAKPMRMPRLVSAAIRAFNESLTVLGWQAVVEVRAAEIRVHVTVMT